MTTMAALLGAVPLMLGTGAGSELRQPLGYAIVGGLAVALIALAVPSEAAPRNSASDNDASLQQRCREIAGEEVGEGEMKSHINRHVVQRWSDCMMGMPYAR